MKIDIESIASDLSNEIRNYHLKSKTSSIYQVSPKNNSSLRYARALFQLAKESGKIEEIRSDVKIFYSSIYANKETFDFFTKPFIERKVKIGMVSRIFKNKVSENGFNFLCMLIERNALHLLSSILDDYISQCNEYYQIAQVHVQSAFEIKDDRPIFEAARTLAGRDVHLHIIINPDLIGGITVEIDGKVYDYSVRMALDLMKKRLDAAPVSIKKHIGY